MTVEEALRRGVSQLSARPELRDDALRDAALLLMHTLGISRAQLRAHPERRFTTDEQVAYQALIQRRLVFEPVQYILGEQEFYGLALKVTPAVLIPRPETELLVEAVLARVGVGFSGRIVDVGTGSGAIAIALALALPGASVTAVDISAAALEVALENASRLEVSVRFLESDLLAAVAGERFEVVVSNPPYVPVGDVLHPQVREFEPTGALFAGVAGMDVYERLIPAAWDALGGGGWMALEFGFGQRASMAGLLAGWEGVEFLEDLAGIPRVVCARRG